jgi:hypothetical protein
MYEKKINQKPVYAQITRTEIIPASEAGKTWNKERLISQMNQQ